MQAAFERAVGFSRSEGGGGAGKDLLVATRAVALASLGWTLPSALWKEPSISQVKSPDFTLEPLLSPGSVSRNDFT